MTVNRPRRTKVKSGCRTCKIRKVKCDEGRPACYRCVSTGRKCDGYGIWGGGGSERPQASAGRNDHVVGPPTRNIPPRNMNAAECECFEWFTLKAVKKLKGVFRSEFWDKLVFQACFNEPAVRHAVLALSSVQRGDTPAQVDRRRAKGSEPDEEEKFVLRQYGKAINHLVQESPESDQPNVNVVLLTCLVFIFLEFLRGHYKAAQSHLRNGLRLISTTYDAHGVDKSGVAVTKRSVDLIDRGILEAFARIQVQVALLAPLNHPFHFVLQYEELDAIDGPFESVEKARQRLDHLLSEITLLEEQHRGLSDDQSPDRISEAFCNQQRLKKDLNSWHKTYQLSTVTIKKDMPFREVSGYRLLHIYYIMATIMTNSIAALSSEAVFDHHTANFRSIVDEAEELRRIVESVTATQDKPAHRTERSQSIADMGWIPPLYYTALKCRDRSIRDRAIELLRVAPHREGIWDTNMTISIVERIMALEEGMHLENSIFHNDLDFGTIWDLASVTESCRIQDVRIQLPDNPSGKVGIAFRGMGANWSWEDISPCTYRS